MASPHTQLPGLAKCLISHGLLDVNTAISITGKAQTHFVAQLVDEGLVNPTVIASMAAQEYAMPLLDLDVLETKHLATSLVNEKLLHKHHALPLLQRRKQLYLAISDPSQQHRLEEIKFQTRMNIIPILVEEHKLRRILKKPGNNPDSLDATNLENQASTPGSDVKDAPIVRYIDQILLDAINSGVSDIHFEPYEKNYRIRFRQDGILYDKASPPVNTADRMATRLKVMACLNIAERRLPQDGRIRIELSAQHAIDFRINTCPTVYGEKVVLRILDATAAKMGIEALGLDEQQRALFTNAIRKPHGMILVTGPTGSGKTVTLYSALNLLNTPQVNIFTAEDPVEVQLSGINQVHINPKIGLTFAEALRAFLRQDPDIVMIGEIRDLETAEIAIKAAQTGHLVLSTLHTNDASQTLTRLAYMGVPSFNIASSINLIIAQRLARKLCPHCKKPQNITQDALLAEGFSSIQQGLTIYAPGGCDLCGNSGYQGRIGLFETMPISDTMERLIMDGANAIKISDQARHENVATLHTSGLHKVKAGLTSLEEVNRVTRN